MVTPLISNETRELQRALNDLDHFVNASHFDVSKLPYQAEASFVHPRHGVTTVQFALDRLANDDKTEELFNVNMIFHFQKAVCKRWISTGSIAKVKEDISRFAKDIKEVSDMLPEFYRAALE